MKIRLTEIFPAYQTEVIRTLFPTIDLSRVHCQWEVPKLENANRAASAKSKGLFSSEGELTFNPSFIPFVEADLGNPLVREIVLHELVHIEQFSRGFLYRLKLWYWRKFVTYEKRPSEIEAFNRGKELANSPLWGPDWGNVQVTAKGD